MSSFINGIETANPQTKNHNLLSLETTDQSYGFQRTRLSPWALLLWLSRGAVSSMKRGRQWLLTRQCQLTLQLSCGILVASLFTVVRYALAVNLPDRQICTGLAAVSHVSFTLTPVSGQ